MNSVSLIGRLVADPELRTTQSGVSYVNFRIAVDRRVRSGEERQADFITIVAWRQTAEFIGKYFAKGQRIAINGSIRTGSFTDRDGNKRYTTEVWADNVEFCESKGNGGGSSYDGGSYNNNSYSNNRQNSYRQSSSAPDSYSSGSDGDFTDVPTDEDLPF